MGSRATVPPCFSFSSSASSRQFMSGGLTSERTLARSMVMVSWLTFTSSGLGTTFRQTMMFKGRLGLSSSLASVRRLDGVDQGREDAEHVVHHAVVGLLEDGGLFVQIDGDDGLSLLDAHRELERAADAADDGQLGTGDVAGL